MVPKLVRLPDARGVPAVGRTWRPEKVTSHLVPLLSRELTVKVTIEAVGVAVDELKAKQEPVPARRVMVAVTVELVLKANPAGAFKIKVPLAGISREAPSVAVGPVKAVYVPPAVSAEIALPPVAGVTVTAAETRSGNAKKNTANKAAIEKTDHVLLTKILSNIAKT